MHLDDYPEFVYNVLLFLFFRHLWEQTLYHVEWLYGPVNVMPGGMDEFMEGQN